MADDVELCDVGTDNAAIARVAHADGHPHAFDAGRGVVPRIADEAERRFIKVVSIAELEDARSIPRPTRVRAVVGGKPLQDDFIERRRVDHVGELRTDDIPIDTVRRPVVIREQTRIDEADTIHRVSDRGGRPETPVDAGLVRIDGLVAADGPFDHEFHPLRKIRGDLQRTAIVGCGIAGERDRILRIIKPEGGIKPQVPQKIGNAGNGTSQTDVERHIGFCNIEAFPMLPEEHLPGCLGGQIVAWIIIREKLFGDAVPSFEHFILCLCPGIPFAVGRPGPRNIIIEERSDPVRIEIIRLDAEVFLRRRTVADDRADVVPVPAPLFGHHVDQSRANLAVFGAEASRLNLKIFHREQADAGVGCIIPFVPEGESVDDERGLIGTASPNGQPLHAGLQPDNARHLGDGEVFDFLRGDVGPACSHIPLNNGAGRDHHNLLRFEDRLAEGEIKVGGLVDVDAHAHHGRRGVPDHGRF